VSSTKANRFWNVLGMERALGPEWLDERKLDPEELARSLDEVWTSNHGLGGTRIVLRQLALLLRDARGPVRILDVGTGAGGALFVLARWAGQRGLVPEVMGVDHDPAIAELARQRVRGLPGFEVRQADARSLPFEDGSFDVATSSLLLHHLDPAGALQHLRELSRVTRVGFVVVDLRRHLVPYAALKAMGALAWKSPVTRHDGPLSVRRAYTVPELRALVNRAGLRVQVRARFPFRLAVVGHA
jgi:SAM-dependent methyltransferase